VGIKVEIIFDATAINGTPYVGARGEITKGTIENGALVQLDLRDERTKRAIEIDRRSYPTKGSIAYTSRELKRLNVEAINTR